MTLLCGSVLANYGIAVIRISVYGSAAVTDERREDDKHPLESPTPAAWQSEPLGSRFRHVISASEVAWMQFEIRSHFRTAGLLLKCFVLKVVARDGIEPPTPAFSGLRS